MSAPAQPALDQPEPTIDTIPDASAVIGAAVTPADLGYPGMGYGADEANEPRLQTFEEMLPAARAFYRKS